MEKHVCPWWIGYILASPLRKLSQDPHDILDGYVRDGMTVLDAGCAMGFFSIPMAEMVGPSGKVVCVDLQEKMLKGLQKRAEKRDLNGRMEYRQCSSETLAIGDMEGTIDFALAFAVVHEVPDQMAFFAEIYRSLKSGGRVLFSEPKGHISGQSFNRSLEIARESGFTVENNPAIKRGLSVIMRKPE